MVSPALRAGRTPLTGMQHSLVNQFGQCLRFTPFTANTQAIVTHTASHATHSSCSSRAKTQRQTKRARLPVHCRSHLQHDQGDMFVITTPLYYVNAAPHMGGAYTTIAADVIARFHRLTGRPVRLITGTDEHGEKIALAAAKRGMQPQEHCDDIVKSYKELWQLGDSLNVWCPTHMALNIKYDRFIRTTDPGHEKLVEEVLERAWEKGDIYAAAYEGWYCVDCEEYKDEGDMDEHKNCPTHRRPCTQRQEENYFFKLTAYQEALEKLLTQNPDFVQPESRRNEVLGFVKEGLRDFSISRAAVEWGIRVPRDPKQTVYVWFDALNGYLSALYEDGSSSPRVSELESMGWPADVHLIGKDILRFHAVYWPAMLMSAGLPVPRKVFGHGFLTKDGMKMGKALGNVLEPVPLVETYGPDAVRYFFMREVELGKDGDFSEERFRNIVNSALANDIGNLLNRTLNLLKKNCGGACPVAAAAVSLDNPLRQMATLQVPVVRQSYEALRVSEAITAIVGLSSRGNQFLEETAPWTALKKGDDAAKAAAKEHLVSVLECVRIVAVLMSPVTPALSAAIYAQLGYDEGTLETLSWDEGTVWGSLPEGREFPQPTPVFGRLEGDFVTEVAAAKAAAVVGSK